MSVKSFIPAEPYLNSFGITIQQAQKFIDLNIEHPEIIYNTARDYGVTTAMLSEIEGIPKDVINTYFESVDKEGMFIDGMSIIVNSDLGALELLVNFNNRTGSLSNTSLREETLGKLKIKTDYDPFFSETMKRDLHNDGIYDAEELGIGHLGNVPAKGENLESIFYGSLINMLSALDKSEWNQITGLRDSGNTEKLHTILFTALSESPSPVAWSEVELKNMVATEAADIIDKYWHSDSTLIGILDHSLLGLATV
ncbi:MAG: hypothetical protein HRU78_14135 [Gammaproteobacteria bacterium]|nr:MAG: hypothetical protein HRU78_14135 [Gammaproteobacteria bacterium]